METQIQSSDLVTAPPALLQPFVIHLAPPFTGFTFIRSPTPWGFWSQVRKNATIGDIVMQLGRRQDGIARYTRGRLEVGWTKRVPAQAGTRFKAVFAAGPISLRPNGGFVDATVLLELRRVSDGRRFSAATRPVSHRQSILEAEVPTTGQYDLKVTGILNSFYWGSANPYGEIIGQFIDVQKIISRPFFETDGGVQSLAALEMSEEELAEKDALAAADEKAFEESEKYVEREESDDPQELANQGETTFEG